VVAPRALPTPDATRHPLAAPGGEKMQNAKCKMQNAK
jgi:hypothetical protein